jgi:hexosaminidase
LIRLEKYDNARASSDKKKAASEVKSYVNQFSSIRKKFEDMITRTRMLANPEGYVPDQNHHHHLANGTINSDWMYVYELALNNRILNTISD